MISSRVRLIALFLMLVSAIFSGFWFYGCARTIGPNATTTSTTLAVSTTSSLGVSTTTTSVLSSATTTTSTTTTTTTTTSASSTTSTSTSTASTTTTTLAPMTLLAVDFHSSGVAWIVGSNGLILHTTDTGATWVSQESGTSSNLYDVYRGVDSFTNTTEVMAAGAGGTVVRTTDGGGTWSQLGTGETNNDLHYVIFSSGINAYGENGVYLYFEEGSWEIEFVPPEQTIYGGDGAIGVSCLVGADGLIVKQVNDEEEELDYVVQDSGTSQTLYDLALATWDSTNEVWVVGAGGTIIRTTDGTNWVAQDSGTAEDLRGVCFLNSNIGFAVGGNGTILKTTDGGDNWVAQDSGTTADLYDVNISGTMEGVGWAVGAEGTILQTDGISWDTQSF